jgi:hypothetical protein
MKWPQQLVQDGQEIGLLALIDTYCFPKFWFDFSAPTLFGKLRAKLGAGVRRVHQNGYLWVTCDRIPEVVLKRIVAINERAIRSYKPQPYSGSVLLLRATQLSESANLTPQFMDETLGWRNMVTGGLEVCCIREITLIYSRNPMSASWQLISSVFLPHLRISCDRSQTRTECLCIPSTKLVLRQWPHY